MSLIDVDGNGNEGSMNYPDSSEGSSKISMEAQREKR
jgi:hypothetical protein